MPLAYQPPTEGEVSAALSLGKGHLPRQTPDLGIPGVPSFWQPPWLWDSLPFLPNERFSCSQLEPGGTRGSQGLVFYHQSASEFQLLSRMSPPHSTPLAAFFSGEEAVFPETWLT